MYLGVYISGAEIAWNAQPRPDAEWSVIHVIPAPEIYNTKYSQRIKRNETDMVN